MNYKRTILYPFNIFKHWIQLYLCLGTDWFPNDAIAKIQESVNSKGILFTIYRHETQPVRNYNHALIKVYNNDSNTYGLKGHSTFMPVSKFRSFMKRNLRSSHTNNFSRKLLLPTRPSATKHSPNSSPFRGARSFFVTSLIREKSLLGFRKLKVRKTPSLSSLSRNDSVFQRVAVPPCRFTIWSLRLTAQRVRAAVCLVQKSWRFTFLPAALYKQTGRCEITTAFIAIALFCCQNF